MLNLNFCGKRNKNKKYGKYSSKWCVSGSKVEIKGSALFSEI
jgi:hypothetical protein